MTSQVCAADLSFVDHGARHYPGLAVSLLGHLRKIADRASSDKAGTRIVGDPDLALLLAPDGVIGQVVSELAGHPMVPVRAILFDKNDAANWALAWHQDRTIAVKERRDLPAYGPWTCKQGLLHVQPPFDLTRRMITVRIHIDEVDEANAPLLIALGSHARGFIPVEEVVAVAAECEPFACLAAPGDVWFYSTPILHASRTAATGRHRRVLQADFSGDALPGGLDWLGI